MRGVRIDLESLVGTAALCGVAFFVLYPILLIVLNSFQVARPGAAAEYSLEGWRVALSDPGMLRAVYNTFSLIFTRQLISLDGDEARQDIQQHADGGHAWAAATHSGAGDGDHQMIGLPNVNVGTFYISTVTT